MRQKYAIYADIDVFLRIFFKKMTPFVVRLIILSTLAAFFN